MKVSPTFTFWLSLLLTIAQGVTSGTVHLTNIVPEAAIPTVTSWVGLFVFVGMATMTALTGVSSAQPGPLAAPPTLKEADEVRKAAVKALGPQ